MEKEYYEIIRENEIYITQHYGNALMAKKQGFRVIEVIEIIKSVGDTTITVKIEKPV